MDSLAAYGSSDDEPAPAAAPKPKPKPKRTLPALPPSLAPPLPPPDPAAHQGRTRTRAHVDGELAAHVYVRVPPARARARVPPGWHAVDRAALHVSLARPVYVRRHERAALRRAVRAAAHAHAPFAASFARLAAFANDERTRAFLALEVGAGHPNLCALAAALAPAVRALHQQAYYARPRFHASVAWALMPPDAPDGDVLPPGVLEALAAEFGDAVRRGAFDVADVCVRIGQDVSAYALQGRDAA